MIHTISIFLTQNDVQKLKGAELWTPQQLSDFLGKHKEVLAGLVEKEAQRLVFEENNARAADAYMAKRPPTNQDGVPTCCGGIPVYKGKCPVCGSKMGD